MDDPPSAEVTRLIREAADGREGAASALLLVYDQLRAIARQRMAGERQDHTLQATALVHEAYARLVGGADIAWNGRSHFYLAAGEAMRRILVEHARARGREKRGGGRGRVALDVVDLAAEADSEEILALDAALRRLDEMDPGAAGIVRLRFYAGLSVEQTAAAMGVSERTVKREWSAARAWMFGTMKGELEAG